MEDDLKALKKGQLPSGVELQKVSEITQTSGPELSGKAPVPAAPLPPRPAMSVELGKTEKTKPMENQKFTAPLPTPPASPKNLGSSASQPSPSIQAPLPPAPSMVIPPTGSSSSSKKIILPVAIVVVVGIVGYLGYSLFGDKFTSTPTPTPVVIEPTPTPTPANPIDTIFGANLTSIIVPVGVPAGSDPYAYLKSSVAAQQVDIGRVLFYKFTDETGNRYSFPAMLARLVINHPQGLNTADFKSEMLLSLYGALNGNKNVGLAVPIPTEEGDFGQYRAVMFEWEITMAKDLATLFELNTKEQTGKTFSENLYQGVIVRYLNFPNPDSTIDYAFVTTPSGITFLAMANSRSHIYAIIDQILGY